VGCPPEGYSFIESRTIVIAIVIGSNLQKSNRIFITDKTPRDKLQEKSWMITFSLIHSPPFKH
jgi:hypothetical protein